MNHQANDFNLEELLAELKEKSFTNEGEEQAASSAAPQREFLTKIQTDSTNSAAKNDSGFTNDMEFDIKFRGYSRLQVDHYLDAISEDYNAICEKCADLEKENEGLRKALAGLNCEVIT